jgi:hypothetical protein
MELFLRKVLNIKLVGNEVYLTKDIISYLHCKCCKKIKETECECFRCRTCNKRLNEEEEEYFVCDGRCKGDIICKDCSDVYFCMGCREDICKNCVSFVCNDCDSVFCCYCENNAVCYCEND